MEKPKQSPEAQAITQALGHSLTGAALDRFHQMVADLPVRTVRGKVEQKTLPDALQGAGKIAAVQLRFKSGTARDVKEEYPDFDQLPAWVKEGITHGEGFKKIVTPDAKAYGDEELIPTELVRRIGKNDGIKVLLVPVNERYSILLFSVPMYAPNKHDRNARRGGRQDFTLVLSPERAEQAFRLIEENPGSAIVALAKSIDPVLAEHFDFSTQQELEVNLARLETPKAVEGERKEQRRKFFGLF